MDNRSYQHLRILEEVDKSSRLTNRMVAEKLGVSVKLAHAVVSGLIKRGMVQVTRRDGRSWNYLLTPAGVSEKVRLTYEYLDFSRHFFTEARRRSSGICLRLAREGIERVAFLGCGELAEIAYLGVREHGLLLAAVYDDKKVGGAFLGLPVQAVSELPAAHSSAEGKRKAEVSCFERILVTAYDPECPERGYYLPRTVGADGRFVWVFDQPRSG